MPVAEIEIINKLGLHARASAKLSQLAAEFPCEILIKTTKIYYGDEMQEGAGYKQYHNISFLSNGTYEIRIENLRTNKIETYTFVITSCCIIF